MKSVSDLASALEKAKQAQEYKKTHKVIYFDPYPYQVRVCNATKDHSQVALMAANRIGKTEVGALNFAVHTTGLYPKWWEGRVWRRPIKAWAAGVNNDKTRDIIQEKLFGAPGNPSQAGLGFIPKDCLGDTIRKPGVPNAIQGAYVKHFTDGVFDGWSYIGLKSYEMEAEGFYGESIDLGWPDEEPNQAIYSQFLTRILDKEGLLLLTFTPEMGVTQVVSAFQNDIKPGQVLINAGWADASEDIRTIGGKPGHLTKAMMEQILAAYHPSERDMRSKGIPQFGRGLVYPIPEEDVLCDPFPIPDHYKVIAGLDPGDDHPTAVSWVAYNVDSDIVYVFDVYRERRQDVLYHAKAIKSRGAWIPVMWPHDANRKNGYGGPSLADMYRREGVKMHWDKFTNPPPNGFTEGHGGNEIMPGIQEILTRMRTGRFKVFKTLSPWLEEFRMYHLDPKNGKPVDKGDDLMQATRYAVQMLRFAQTRKYAQQSSDKINYRKLGIV